MNAECCYDLSSDHSPVILTLSKSIIKKATQPTLENKSTNWEKVKADLADRINLKVPLKTKEQLDTDVDIFVNIIQETVRKHTLKFERRLSGINFPREIWEKVIEK